MAVSLDQIRDELMPRLLVITDKYSVVQAMWVTAFDVEQAEAAAPLLPMSLSAAVAMGAAAVVIKNPTVTRRFWS